MCVCVACSNFVSQYFEALKELFELDPRLVQDIIYVCPKDSLPELLHHLDLNLSVAWFLHVGNRKSDHWVSANNVCTILFVAYN